MSEWREDDKVAPKIEREVNLIQEVVLEMLLHAGLAH
jgi:hypothetical protein